jgi:uncharacterized membrane protein YjfL (UPF0719 family)
MGMPGGATAVVATSGIFLGLAYLFVLIRLSSRVFVVKKFDWADITLALTLALYTCFTAFICVVASVHEFQYAITPFNPLVTISGLNRGSHYFFLAELFYSKLL